MRALTVGNVYPPQDFGGGYELVWQSAVRHVRAAGHEVRVLTTDLHTGRRDAPEDDDVHRELRWYRRDDGYPRRSLIGSLGVERHNASVLERHLRDFRPDVVSWWSMGGLSLGLVELVRRRGLPAVAFVHDDWLDYGRRADQWHRRFRRPDRLARVAERLAGVPTRVSFPDASKYVFVSSTTRDRARATGVALPDTAIAHSGIDPSFIDPAPERPWQWRLLYVGRIDPRKGVDVAVEALADLPDAARLTVVGGGDAVAVEELRAGAQRLGAADRVELTGVTARGDLPPLYEAADVVVFPVRWHEPWGLVPLEAMAQGRPVVATGRGGSGEYLRDGHNCLLCPADDPSALAAAVRRLAGDAPLRARLREGGLETARAHTETAFNDTVLAELETAAAPAHGAPAAQAAAAPAAPDAPRLSVVIPTYRRHDALARTLDALERQTVPQDAFEVIVVDDPEEDDSAAVAAAVAADARPFATRHLHRHARGVSAARNVGWRAARAPLVMFLGDDILGDRALLGEHLSWHRRHPDASVGVLGHVRWARELKLTPFMRWLEYGLQFNYHTIQGDEAGWGHFYTSNISLKRSLLEQVGGFDEERFPFLYEDLDIGYRLAERGFRLLYNRRARAQHLHQTDLEQWRRRMAATALAEREWIRLHPRLRPYFHERLSAAAARPAHRGRTGRYLLRWVPTWTPWLGRRVWGNATIYYRQQLAPAFLQAWQDAEAR